MQYFCEEEENTENTQFGQQSKRRLSRRKAKMADDTPVLGEPARGSGEAPPQETNNRGNFTRNLNTEPDEAIAKKMFFGGLLLLPWLHAVNIIHYRKQFVDPSIDPKVTLCTFLSIW